MLYDRLCNSKKVNKALNKKRNSAKNFDNFHRVLVKSQKGDYHKIAFYYTKKTGDRVLVACRDLNADIVRYYLANWVTKYTGIYNSLRDYIEFTCLSNCCEFRETYNIEQTFSDM